MTSTLSIPLSVTLAISTLAWAQPKHDPHDDNPPVKAADPHDDPHADNDGHDHHGDAEVPLTPAAIKKYGLQVGQVKKQVLAGAFTAPARVAFNGDAKAHVGSAVSGRVSELRAKLGDVVKKGDLLLLIDSPEFGEAQSDLLLKHTNVETARPALRVAKDAYDRAKQLFDQSQGIALGEVQKRESELRAAEGALKSAEASATAAENKLQLYGMSPEDIAGLMKSQKITPQYRVTAPIDGEVVDREITLGELVRPDRDALLMIADLSTVWVVAEVPETRLTGIVKGAAARIKVAAHKDKSSIDGTVAYVSPVLDPNTRTTKVRIEAKGANGLLRPGMFAQVFLTPAGDGETVLAIPEEAVQTVEGGPAVFVPVKGEPNTFAKRAVTVGPPTAGMVQVFKGLEEGESFVTAGSFILKAELGKAGAAHEH